MTPRIGDPAVMARYDQICRTIAKRGTGLTLSQLGDAHALARAEQEPTPDAGSIRFLRGRLRLDEGEE